MCREAKRDRHTQRGAESDSYELNKYTEKNQRERERGKREMERQKERDRESVAHSIPDGVSVPDSTPL